MLDTYFMNELCVENSDETAKANVEDNGKLSKSEAMVDPYPENADETTEANLEDDSKIFKC